MPVPRPRRPGRPRKYSWERLFRQSWFRLRRGVDYDCPQSAMAQQIRNAASSREKRVRLVDKDDHFIVFVEPKTKALLVAVEAE